MKKVRRTATVAGVLVALLVPLGALPTAGNAVPAPTITRVAGALGTGPAHSVAMETAFIAASGPRVYVSDESTDVIRLVDLTRGQATVVAGDGSDGTNVSDGNPATSGAVSPGPLVVAPDGSLVFLDNRATWNRPMGGGSWIRRVDRSGVVSTIAGNGTFGLSGDGGPATAASFSNPNQFAYDPASDLVVADQNNCRVREVTPAGIVTTLAGTVCGARGAAPDGTLASVAQLGPIAGVAVDSTGTVYFSDQVSCVVRRIDTAGRLVTVAGNGSCSPDSGDGGPATVASLFVPSTIAVDGSGDLYVTDNGGRMRRVDSTGAITTFAGGGSSGADGIPAAQSTGLYDPVPVGGSVYGGDGNRVRVVDTSRIISTVAGDGTTASSGDGGPATSAQVNDGAIAVRNGVVGALGDSRLRTINITGTITTRTLSGPGLSAIGPYPTGMAEDSAGNVYTAFVAAFSIVKIDPAGVVTTVGSNPRPSVQAVDGSGDVYYLYSSPSPHDAFAGVAKLDPTTGQSTELYQTTTTPYPSAAAVGPNGQVVFASGCQVMMIVTAITAAVPATTAPVAGTGTCGDTGDGGPATSAQVGAIYALAFDQAGDLFIADYDHHKIREVRTGTISTLAGTGTAGLGGDGGPAAAATLDEVTGLAVDSGNVYVADRYRIREIHLTG